MYEYSLGLFAEPTPSRKRAPAPRARAANSVQATDPNTHVACQATERRISPVVEPPPSELVKVDAKYLADPTAHRKLHRAAYEAYKKLKAAAEKDGIPSSLLTIVSAYRSVAHQKQLYADALKKYKDPAIARRWVAPPGGSPHHTGRAIDFWLGLKNSSANAAKQRSLPAYRWLVCNAAKFGFTPYAVEPWHWEFNPPGFTTGASVPAPGGRVPPRPSGPSRAPARPPAHTPGATAPGPLRLIGRETQPPGETLYVNIALGSEAPSPPMTGIFIPAGYRPQPAVDLIVYLHGFKTSSPTTTIAQYWNKLRFPNHSLREGVNDSGKNVILAAPTLGPHSQAGRLTRPGGFDWYLGQVMTALRQFGPYRSAPAAVGRIILACHSGGGWPMRVLATSRERLAANIRECWGFDCLYNRNDDTVWAQWAKLHPGNKLYVYYLTTTAALSRALQAQHVPNVFVAHSTARIHDQVPVAHWKDRIAGAAFLANR